MSKLKPTFLMLAMLMVYPMLANARDLTFETAKEYFSEYSYTERVKLQAALRDYGYTSTLDGLFGKGTYAALKEYIRENNIKVSGASFLNELIIKHNPLETVSSTERVAQFSIPIISEIWKRTDYVNFGAAALGDFDGDGKAEMVMSAMHEKYMENVWAGDKPKRDVHWLERNKLFDSITFYTLQNRGKDTLAMTNYNFKYTGDEYKYLQAAHIVTGDLNGDGIDDIAVGCHGYDKKPWPGGPQAILLSNGNKKFQVKEVIKGRTFVNSIVLIDADSDGDLDILYGTKKNRVLAIYNDGLGNFTKPLTLLRNIKARRLDALDVNNDGLDDLIVAGMESKGEPTKVLWNSKNGKFSVRNGVTLQSVPGYPRPKAFFADENYLFISRATAKHDGAYIQKIDKQTLETVSGFSFSARHASGSVRVNNLGNGVIEMGGLLPEFMTSFKNTDRRFK